MSCKRKSCKYGKSTNRTLMKTKPIRRINVVKKIALNQDKTYLSRLMNVVKGLSFGIVEQGIGTVRKTIMDTLSAYSKSATDYLYTKLKIISPIKDHMEKYVFLNIRKVMTDTTDLFTSYITKQTTDGNARSIIVKLWNTKRLREIEVSERISMIRSIIRATIKSMTDLEIQLFHRLMLPTNEFFPNISKYYYNRNKYITCINNRMRNDTFALDIVIQNLQSWYLIQPVVLQIYKVAGKYSSNIDNIISDLEALYENYLFIKYDNNKSK